jgi:hypothetical protein
LQAFCTETRKVETVRDNDSLHLSELCFIAAPNEGHDSSIRFVIGATKECPQFINHRVPFCTLGCISRFDVIHGVLHTH